MPFVPQLFTALAPLFATISAGTTIGFSAVLIPQLQSNSSSISVSDEQASWIASLAAFGEHEVYAKAAYNIHQQ